MGSTLLLRALSPVSWRDPERTLRRIRVLSGSSPMVPSPHPSACYALAAAYRRKDAQVNQFHDHGVSANTPP
jgi:hypothetical protein